MMNQMQSTISPGLQKLMQSVEELKQLSSPQTPSGAPTLAAQVEQAAAQVASQAAPSAEMPGMLPNDPYRAQLMQTLQAKAQEQAQRMAMLAQGQQPQGRAQGGIASLPADVEMAEGGVVGYNGEDGSKVELPVNERLKRMFRGLYERIETNLMRQAGATPEQIAQKLGKEPPVAPVARPMSEMETARLQEANAAPAGMPVAAPAPRPSGGRKQPVTPTPIESIPLLPDTRESTLVNPSQSELKYATEVGRLRDLQERLNKKPEDSPQEKAYRDAVTAEYQRGIGSIDSARKRFTAAQAAQSNKDIINYLSGIGGAGSLFRGMTRSGQALSQVQDQREAAKVAYFDKLDERRNAVENLKLASLKQDAEQARAWSNEIRKIDADITKLIVGLGEKQAGEFAATEREREKAAATARENELNRKAQRELEEYRRRTQMMKPRELEEIHRIENLKLNELTGSKPWTATTQQKLEAIQFAHESVKGAGRAEGVQARNRAEAYKRYAEWEKGPGEMLRMANIKNPKVFEDAARAKKREIYESLGLEIPGMGGGSSGQEPPPNIKAILNKYGS